MKVIEMGKCILAHCLFWIEKAGVRLSHQHFLAHFLALVIGSDTISNKISNIISIVCNENGAMLWVHGTFSFVPTVCY